MLSGLRLITGFAACSIGLERLRWEADFPDDQAGFLRSEEKAVGAAACAPERGGRRHHRTDSILCHNYSPSCENRTDPDAGTEATFKDFEGAWPPTKAQSPGRAQEDEGAGFRSATERG